MIIGISGAHSTGKTTYFHQATYNLKKDFGNERIKAIPESVRDCPLQFFSKDNKSSKEAQLWIFGNQIKKEIEAKKNADIVIIDRTIFDVIAYTMEVDMKLAKDMIKMSRHLYYDIVCFLRPNGKLIDDGQRSVSSELQKRIDNNIKFLLHRAKNVGKIK